MTKTVYRKLGAKRFSARPRRVSWMSVPSFETMIGRLDSASARLKAQRRKSR